jgi:hypothetical protein
MWKVAKKNCLSNSAKRYERMMKAHGIATAASPSKGSNSSPTKGGSSKGSPSKKRRIAEAFGSVGGSEEVLGIGVKSECSDDNTIEKGPVVEKGNSGESAGEVFGALAT